MATATSRPPAPMARLPMPPAVGVWPVSYTHLEAFESGDPALQAAKLDEVLALVDKLGR